MVLPPLAIQRSGHAPSAFRRVSFDAITADIPRKREPKNIGVEKILLSETEELRRETNLNFSEYVEAALRILNQQLGDYGQQRILFNTPDEFTALSVDEIILGLSRQRRAKTLGIETLLFLETERFRHSTHFNFNEYVEIALTIFNQQLSNHIAQKSLQSNLTTSHEKRPKT